MKIKRNPLIIFGAGKIAEVATYFFNRDSSYEVHAYVVDDAFLKEASFLNKPLIGLSSLEETYSAQEYTIFIALGYQDLNNLRREKFFFFKERGYQFASYCSPFVQGQFEYGVNTIIMDGAIIQAFTRLGNNVFVWGGALLGHHSEINDHSWLSGSSLIGGSAVVSESCFIGMGAIIGHEVKLGKECMIGAGTLILRNIDDYSVTLQQQTEISRLNSSQFIRMSTCFMRP